MGKPASVCKVAVGFCPAEPRLIDRRQPDTAAAAVRIFDHRFCQFQCGSHRYAASRSGSRITWGRHRSRAKICEGPFVTSRTSSARFSLRTGARAENGLRFLEGFTGICEADRTQQKPVQLKKSLFFHSL
jgi:hypothetical protein